MVCFAFDCSVIEKVAKVIVVNQRDLEKGLSPRKGSFQFREKGGTIRNMAQYRFRYHCDPEPVFYFLGSEATRTRGDRLRSRSRV